MKSKTHFIVFLLILLSATQFINAQSTEEQLIGAWTFDYQASLEEVDKATKENYKSLLNTPGSKFEAFYKDQKVSFKVDGTYEVSLSDGTRTLTKWELSNNNKTLKLIFSEDVVQTFIIETLDSNLLVLRPKADGQKKMFFPTFYYNKNN